MVLRIEDDARVRLLTFDRPEARNAFNNELYHACARALDEAAARADIACVVLTGAGDRAFCAGQDLAEMFALGEPGSERGEAQDHGFPHFMRALISFPKPLVAAVNGVGVGLGLTMLLHCDIVFIACGARLKAPFTSLGVVPEAASSYLLPRIMGDQAAARALYTSEWIGAADAVRHGLALAEFEPDDLLDETLELARRIAAMPVVSLVETKRLVQWHRHEAIGQARRREDEVFGRLTMGPANREALSAFLEKRDPDFTGL